MSQEHDPIYVKEATLVLLGGKVSQAWVHWFADRIPRTMICLERPNTMEVKAEKCDHCADPHFADLTELHERVYLPAFAQEGSGLPIQGKVVLGLPINIFNDLPEINRHGRVIRFSDEHGRIEVIPAIDG